MQLEQFHYLLEISQHKSMNAASKTLHLTPQALSASMKRLEEELGLPILERTTMGVSLTDKGQALLHLVENFISGLEELQDEPLLTANSFQAPMHLALPYGFSETYLPGLLKNIYADYPQTEVITTPYGYTEILQQVIDGLLDYGLTYKIYINGVDQLLDIPATLDFTPLYKAKFQCCASNKLPIAKYKSISLKTFLEYPIIMYEPANYLMMKIVTYAGRPEKLINVPTVAALNELLNEGIGIAISLFNLNAGAYCNTYTEQICHIHFKEHITAEFGYITQKNKTIGPEAQKQIQYLTRFFAK